MRNEATGSARPYYIIEKLQQLNARSKEFPTEAGRRAYLQDGMKHIETDELQGKTLLVTCAEAFTKQSTEAVIEDTEDGANDTEVVTDAVFEPIQAEFVQFFGCVATIYYRSEPKFSLDDMLVEFREPDVFEHDPEVAAKINSQDLVCRVDAITSCLEGDRIRDGFPRKM